MDELISAAIKQRLDQAKNVLISAHVRPDGDAIGSLLGLGLALEDAGKNVQMVLADGVPERFRFLEGTSRVVKSPSSNFDTFITVDSAEFGRIGALFDGFAMPDINIDHHITNTKFGKINFIVPDAVATTAILSQYLPKWGYTITKPIAAALMTGLVTDTLGFRTSNMTSDALRQAAMLVDAGINLPEIYYHVLVARTYPAARYWGAGLSSLQQENGIVHAVLTLQDRLHSGYTGNDDADLINIISSINGSQVGMIFVEQDNGHVKISWRALQPGVDVSTIAHHFGGGGHQAAAGADLSGTLQEIQTKVLKKTREMLGMQ